MAPVDCHRRKPILLGFDLAGKDLARYESIRAARDALPVNRGIYRETLGVPQLVEMFPDYHTMPSTIPRRTRRVLAEREARREARRLARLSVRYATVCRQLQEQPTARLWMEEARLMLVVSSLWSNQYT